MPGKVTFTIIKPGAVERNLTGPILAKMNEAGFVIKALKYTKLKKEQACEFYQEHEGKPFYDYLTDFMSRGPIVVVILEKENAVADFRKLIGSTDPAEAEEGTIRKLYAQDKRENAVHGSDSDASAIRESDFFFSRVERF
ncbi:nucleoside-diphosphate kinase [Mangrovibacterium diazotrophicum]|uniref:nucleoside-diphosphate kinase n=1 Tax=Mangrovibacterium diazotrophicum TaxID=1261403 RepID=A0A419W4W4_9BACT|nr:nucleoside-diphosphate kinase [Mangrovibacterium diazotrophicum]RKD90485.1 nucleoside diphosphate kinase [Mangrovibacterium diazotrophicum]